MDNKRDESSMDANVTGAGRDETEVETGLRLTETGN